MRLDGPSRTWTPTDGAELGVIVAKAGPAFWLPASTPECLATWSYAREKADPYAMRARALALIACRRWPQAVEGLSRLGRELTGETRWMVKMHQQSESLRVLVERKPEAALDELRRWENKNTRELGLSPE